MRLTTSVPIIFAVIGLAAACAPVGDSRESFGETAAAVEGAPGKDKVFREHRFKKRDKPTKAVTQDCTEYGSSDCDTGLCIHTSPEPFGDWLCSKTCSGDSECPAKWRCRVARPSSDTGVCAPSPDGSPPRDRPAK